MLIYNLKQLSDDEKLAIWDKAAIVIGYEPNKFRKDIAGAWIQYDKYGDISNELGLGWEADHKIPSARGGADDLDNLRPLQWKNNRSKGDNFPIWESSMTSSGNENIYKKRSWQIN